MKDLRVVNARVVLPVHSVFPLRGFYPPSILVVGSQFSKTESVELNGVLVKEYAITADDRIIVRLPDSLIGKSLNSVRIYSTVSLANMDAIVSMGLTRPVLTVAGIDRLVQSWLLLFFTTPGSDVFSKESGGGGNTLIGKSTDREYRSVASDVAIAVNKTKAELQRTQAVATGIPLSEKLLTADMEQCFFDQSTSTLNVVVSIQNMLGQFAQVSLG